tara:strand:- start:5215 stop:5745 length:531 start_codon:yes stop_codon:yes gene_type:complete
MDRMFDAPIPGQSLTGEPKNNPWENPSDLDTVEDATVYYIQKLANQEVLDDFAVMCETGVPLKPIVESIYMQGVMRGVHTIDTGMLVAPVMTEFLKQALKSMGVNPKVEPGDAGKRAKQKEMDRFRMVAMDMLRKDTTDEPDAGKELLEEIVEEQGDEAVEPVTQEDAPKGLMAKE